MFGDASFIVPQQSPLWRTYRPQGRVNDRALLQPRRSQPLLQFHREALLLSTSKIDRPLSIATVPDSCTFRLSVTK